MPVELAFNNNEWQIGALGDFYRINLSGFIDILSKDYSYDKFKEEYFKNSKSRKENDYSTENFIEKDLAEKYYKILGCNQNDSDDEVRKIYNDLVKSFHPDVIQSKNLHKDIIDFANN